MLHLLGGLLASLEADVPLLESIETGEDTGTGNTTEDVGTSTLEESSTTIVLENLASAVERAGVLGGLADGHHHATTDSVERVGEETRDDGDTVSKSEGGSGVAILAKEHGAEGIVETEVEATVDDNTNAGDDEATVETGNTIGSNGLLVDIKETVVLALTTSRALGALHIVGETGTGIVEGVDEKEGESTSGTTSSNVLGELGGVGLVLLSLEGVLNSVLEGEVKSLGGEVTNDVSGVTTPEGANTLGGNDTLGAVNDTGVGAVKTARLDHLSLVLDDELDTLDGGSHSLGSNGSSTREEEVLHEAELVRGVKGFRH